MVPEGPGEHHLGRAVGASWREAKSEFIERFGLRQVFQRVAGLGLGKDHNILIGRNSKMKLLKQGFKNLSVQTLS